MPRDELLAAIGPSPSTDEFMAGMCPPGSAERAALPDRWVARLLALTERRTAALAAERAELVAQLAGQRPASADGGRSMASVPEVMDVSEWLPCELALVHPYGERRAGRVIRTSLALTWRFPATLDLLARGGIDEARAEAVVDLLEPLDEHLAARVEALVLPKAPGRTPTDLRASTRRCIDRLDPEARERRHRRAQADADVRWWPTEDGMARMAADLTLPAAAACGEVIDGLARQLRDGGDERPIGQLRAEVFSDLVLRPWAARASVGVSLVVHAGLSTLADGRRAGRAGRPPRQRRSVPGAARAGGRVGPPPARRRHARVRGARRRGRPGRGGHPPGPRSGSAGRRAPAATPDDALPTHAGTTAVRSGARPPVSAPALQPPGRPDRPRPRPAVAAGPHRLRRPLLPLPAAPPAQDACPELALPPAARRPPRRDDAVGDHPGHRPTAPAAGHTAPCGGPGRCATRSGRRGHRVASLGRPPVRSLRPAGDGCPVRDAPVGQVLGRSRPRSESPMRGVSSGSHDSVTGTPDRRRRALATPARPAGRPGRRPAGRRDGVGTAPSLERGGPCGTRADRRAVPAGARRPGQADRGADRGPRQPVAGRDRRVPRIPGAHPGTGPRPRTDSGPGARPGSPAHRRRAATTPARRRGR